MAADPRTQFKFGAALVATGKHVYTRTVTEDEVVRRRRRNKAARLQRRVSRRG